MLKIFMFIVVVVGLTTCTKIPPYDEEGLERQAQMNADFLPFEYSYNERKIQGVHTGKSCNPAVIFIHGTPGDWKAWGSYLGDKQLTDKAFMVAVDRLGFGKSGAETPELSLAKQAESIMLAARKEHSGPFLLVGHSYGGAVQMQIAIDYPKQVAGMIFLAGAIDPKLQRSRWYHYLANIWPVSALLPKPLQVATEEMLSLPSELSKQQPSLKSIKTPMSFIQGSDDWLVPAANTDYAKKQLTHAKLQMKVLPEQGHFIPWEQYELVKSTLLEKLGTMQATCPRK